MKKILCATIAVILSMFLCFPVALAAKAASLAKVTFNDVATHKGDCIEIIVSLSDCPEIKSMAVVPLYDTRRLEYISGEWLIGGALLSDWDQDEQNGVILYSSETDVNGHIAKFKFQLTDNDSWDDIEFSCKVVLKNGNSTIEVEVDTLKIFIICDHEWEDEIHTKNSTCTEKGYTYKLCSVCNREDKITDIEKIPHTASEWIFDKESTLNEVGLRHKECLVCNEILENETTPLLGKCNHVWGEELFIQESTCSKLGMVYNVCQICGQRNKLLDIHKLTHVSGDWIIDKEATLEEEGVRHKKCLVCDENFEEETIPRLEQCIHIWSEELFIQESTCSEQGMVFSVCQICGHKNKLLDIQKAAHVSSDWLIDKEATLEEEGACHKECSNCGELIERSIISQLIKSGMDPWLVAITAVSTGVGVGLIVFLICFFVFLNRKRG